MVTVKINPDRILSKVDRNIFGHFTEHAVDCIYGGIYDEKSPLSDSNGLRKDVIELTKKVRAPQIRYPGGNFVSNYHWLDGIGPKDQRKHVFDYAWKVEENNHFGTIEFIQFCRQVGAEPYLCCNMGTGTIGEAMAWVEFCNGTGNTQYAKMRKELGYEEPFNVKYWGLGNEMYGPWQCGQMNAIDYAKAAREFGKAMRTVDPNIILVACGNEIDQSWNAEVIKQLNGLIDYISIHHYSIAWGYPYEFSHDYLRLMTVSQLVEDESRVTRATIESVTGDCESSIKIAWDEWNLNGWFFDGVDDDSTYDLTNAIVTSSFLNTMIRNSNIIGMANYSPFVNLSGAIKVTSDGVKIRPMYHVFDLYGNHTGAELVDTFFESETFQYNLPYDLRLQKRYYFTANPPESTPREIPYLDIVTTKNDKTLFIAIVNKHPEKEYPLMLQLDSYRAKKLKVYRIYSENVTDYNSVKTPDNISIIEQDFSVVGEAPTLVVPKHSINIVELTLDNAQF